MFLSCLFFLFFFSLIPSNPSEIGLSMTDDKADSAKVTVGDVMVNVQLSEDMLDYWYDDLSEEERKAAAAIDTLITFVEILLHARNLDISVNRARRQKEILWCSLLFPKYCWKKDI